MRGAQGINRAQVDFGKLGRIFQPQLVREPLVRFGRKKEALRCQGYPVFQRRRGGQPVKGVVDLDAVQPPRVILQELLGSHFLGIEPRLPAWIGES